MQSVVVGIKGCFDWPMWWNLQQEISAQHSAWNWYSSCDDSPLLGTDGGISGHSGRKQGGSAAACTKVGFRNQTSESVCCACVLDLMIMWALIQNTKWRRSSVNSFIVKRYILYYISFKRSVHSYSFTCCSACVKIWKRNSVWVWLRTQFRGEREVTGESRKFRNLFYSTSCWIEYELGRTCSAQGDEKFTSGFRWEEAEWVAWVYIDWMI
jgi:hypothetical protein